LRRVDASVDANISERRAVSIFRAEFRLPFSALHTSCFDALLHVLVTWLDFENGSAFYVNIITFVKMNKKIKLLKYMETVTHYSQSIRYFRSAMLIEYYDTGLLERRKVQTVVLYGFVK
jgi:hypothetical protein